LTGVSFGVVASGTSVGGMAIEHDMVAVALTSGGMARHCTPAGKRAQAAAGTPTA